MNSLFPYLSEYDSISESDGSLDPIGVFPIGDRLAQKLTPGVRQRMVHPRFLTAMAVGAAICSDFDEEMVAKDGVSDPWQVYEWYVVQALVKSFYNDLPQIRGLSGRDKAIESYKKNLPLNVARYLKTASVFGFHGVYRTLANEIHITEGYRNLGIVGDELVRVWEKEQNLEGFYSKSSGPGLNFRTQLFNATKDGLEKGEVARSWNWGFNEEIAKHLAPYKAGGKELEFLYQTMKSQTSPIRAELINLLEKEECIKVWMMNGSEMEFHRAILKYASVDLKTILLAIQHYESFALLINNAFNDCLYQLSSRSSVNVQEFANLETVMLAASRINEYYENALKYLEPVGESQNFQQFFSSLNELVKPVEWIEILLEYHKNNQKRKPPAGKRPWVEKIPGNSYVIYSRYKQEKSQVKLDGYVNLYRTNSLYSFLNDFKKVEYGKSV